MGFFLDVSMLLRWSGPPAGIMRVEAELARYALDGRPDVEFVFYDARVSRFRLVLRNAIEPLLEGRLGIDIGGIPDARAVKRGPLRQLLHRFDRRLLALRRPRRFIVESLERLRRSL